MYARVGSYISGGDHIFQGGVIYFRGGDRMFQGGGSDIFLGGGSDIFLGESDIFGGGSDFFWGDHIFFWGDHIFLAAMIYFSGVPILPKGSHESGRPMNRNTPLLY